METTRYDGLMVGDFLPDFRLFNPCQGGTTLLRHVRGKLIVLLFLGDGRKPICQVHLRAFAKIFPRPRSTGCASSLSYLARFTMRRFPIGRFGEVASDLVARHDAPKALSHAFDERKSQPRRGARGCLVGGELQRSLRP